MRPVVTVAELRAREAAVAAVAGEAALIERASCAVARRALLLLGGGYGRRVVVLAGKGHNGADALWAGVRLAERGARVDVALPIGPPADEHGADALRRLRARGAAVAAGDAGVGLLDGADLAVDGMLGLGATGELRGAPAALAGALAVTGVPVLAVDLPSGVDADTGAAGVAVRADVTVTFGALKPGLVTGAGAELAGVVEVAEIGLAPDGTPAIAVLDADDVAGALPRFAGETDKYARGVVGLVAGSPEYAGAAVLAAGGAVRAGAGMVRLYADPAVADAVRRDWPEVVAAAGDPGDDTKVTAWVVGPGLGTGPEAAERVRAVLADPRPVLVDADGLGVVAREPGLLLRRTGGATVLTPHTGEFARLTGRDRAATSADRIGAARTAARELGAVVLLKGLTTVVAAPDGTVRVNPTGSAALATAGTGDVLSGAAGAYLASGLEPLAAAATAAWVHGMAGRIAAGDPPAPIVAADVSARWPDAVRVASGE